MKIHEEGIKKLFKIILDEDELKLVELAFEDMTIVNLSSEKKEMVERIKDYIKGFTPMY